MDLNKKKKHKNLDKNIKKDKSINEEEANIKSPKNTKKENKEEFDPTHKLMERFTGKIDLNELNENISQAQLIFNRFGDKSAINKEKENSAKKDIYHEDLEYINSLDDYSGEDEIVYQDIYEEIEENDDIDKLNDKKSFIGKVKEFLGLSEDYYEDEDEFYDGLDYEEIDSENIYNESIDDINDENQKEDYILNIESEENEISIEPIEIEEKEEYIYNEDDNLLDTQELNLDIEEDLLNDRKRYSSENKNRRRIKENSLNEDKEKEENIEEDDKILDSFVKNVKTAIKTTVDDKEEEKQQKKLNKEKKNSNKKEKNNKENIPVKDKEVKNKKPVFKIFSLLLLVVLIAFGSYVFISGSNKYTLEEVYPTFVQALEEKDVNKLESLLEFDGLGRKPTSEEMTSFLNLIEEDESYKQDLMAKLNEDLEFFNKDINYESTGFIKIKKEGKKYLVKDAYILEVGETKAKSLDGNILLKNGKDIIIKTEEGENVVPGIYEGITENGILKLSSSLKIDNRYLNDGEVDINFNEADAEIANETRNIEDGESKIKINSSEKSAIVFVNGENTELTVKEFNRLDSQDLKIGDKLALALKLPWGYATSEEEEVKGNKDSISLQVKKADNYMKEKFINIIKKTLKEDEIGYETGDLSVFTTITGTQMERNRSWINGNKSYGGYYIKDYRKLELDMDSFEVGNNWQGPGYVGYIGGYITYGQEKYNKNYQEKPSKDELTLHENERVGFHFKWMEDEKEWKIYMWGNTYRPISSKNLEEVDLK